MVSHPHDEPLELRSKIPGWAHGLPLVEYLAQRFPYHDRAAWTQLLQAGRLRHCDRPVTEDVVLGPGDTVTYLREHTEPPVRLDLELVHVDDAVVVATKPPHLPSHSDGAFIRHTMLHQLSLRVPGTRPRLVHRLDRETSGLMVFARTAAASRALEAQFRSGRVHKEYLAVAHGRFGQDTVEVDAPIGFAPGSAIQLRRAVCADGAPAATRFEVLERLADATLVRAVPATGRTHQIRVHLEHLGHPLVGDCLYGQPDEGYLAFLRHVKSGGDPMLVRPCGTNRQLLHAAVLEFDHPLTGAPTRFESPAPADFTDWMQARRGADTADPA
ncbi:MAG: hypothetical protein RL148_1934 [Planctomycetota bacterium]